MQLISPVPPKMPGFSCVKDIISSNIQSLTYKFKLNLFFFVFLHLIILSVFEAQTLSYVVSRVFCTILITIVLISPSFFVVPLVLRSFTCFGSLMSPSANPT